MSDRVLVNRATDIANDPANISAARTSAGIDEEDVCLQHLGMGSPSVLRNEYIDNQRSLVKRYKRRKFGHAPKSVSDIAQRVSFDARCSALKSVATYSDTVTCVSSNNHDPKHIVLTIVLNEVKSTDPSGGVMSYLHRDKPEVIVVCDSKAGSKRAINAFVNAFDRDQNKRDKYVSKFIERGNHCNLLSAVSEYSLLENNKRLQPKLKPLSIEDSQMNILSHNVTTVMATNNN